MRSGSSSFFIRGSGYETALRSFGSILFLETPGIYSWSCEHPVELQIVENRHLNVSALDLHLTKRFYVSGQCRRTGSLSWSAGISIITSLLELDPMRMCMPADAYVLLYSFGETTSIFDCSGFYRKDEIGWLHEIGCGNISSVSMSTDCLLGVGGYPVDDAGSFHFLEGSSGVYLQKCWWTLRSLEADTSCWCPQSR